VLGDIDLWGSGENSSDGAMLRYYWCISLHKRQDKPISKSGAEWQSENMYTQGEKDQIFFARSNNGHERSFAAAGKTYKNRI